MLQVTVWQVGDRLHRGLTPRKGAVFLAMRSEAGLSPIIHPAMSRVPVSFEPIGLGGATGWGAEPPV